MLIRRSTMTTKLVILSLWLIIGSAWSFGQNPKKAARVPAFVTVLRPHGFEPSSVSLDVRQFFLITYNRTGLDKLTLSLDRLHGNNVKQVDVIPATPQSIELLDLTPGTYTLSESTHPKWTCQIVVK